MIMIKFIYLFVPTAKIFSLIVRHFLGTERMKGLIGN